TRLSQLSEVGKERREIFKNMEKRTPLLSVVFGLLLISTFLECSEINREEQYTFNLALWTKVKTTSTCGAKPEVYCILTGAGKKKKRDQDCSICDKEHYYHTHPITYATDGSEKWWKSENYVHEVNITMDLGQEFFIAYVVLKMGRSPRPGNWILEKSVDFGRTYTPWQYFGMTESDCFHQYGVYEKRSASTEDEVLCSTEYSSILPLEYGEIHLNLLKGRPGAETFYSNKKLQKWAKATNIRLRLQKIRTLNADLMMISNHDTTVTRRYFYSIRDISIGGRCVCYGHADRCLRNTNTGNLECRCLHNTCGPSCMQCCPGFNQFPWQPTTPKENNTCQACHCFNHASHCYYNGNVAKNKLSLNINGQFEGGGVCVNCQHNTVGVNCNECKPGMYRPFKKSHYDWDACKDCNCNANGSLDSVCNNVGGRCKCTTGVTGQKCDRCEIGLWNFPNCRDCECHVIGSYTEQCDPKNGTCRCKPGVGGRNCQICTSRSLKYPGISLLTDMGCLPCDDCTMTLINESMSLTNKTMIEITDLKTYDIMDFFTIKISNSWQNIWDYEDFMEALLEGTDSLTREPLVYEFNILVNVEERYAMYVENSAKQVRKKAGLISNYAKELHHDTQQVIMKSRQVT
ncbi:LAMA1 (predicted), partial [Pycnogonum litorale]